MGLLRKLIISIPLTVLVAVTVNAAVGDQLLKVPLFEVGGLWIRAVSDFSSRLMDTLTSMPYLTSPMTYLVFAGGCVALYYLHMLFYAPLNRIKLLGDIGYAPEGTMSMKDMVNLVRKRRMVGEIPPPFPNGWFGVLESRDLKKADVKNVGILGLNLAAFRGEDGRAHVIDAYCPHNGANLAVGGRVLGNCLECPFHGWQFRGDDGKCVVIPYIDNKNIPDKAKVTSYEVLEMNGFIYIWHHAEKIEPNWTPPEMEEITGGEWTYRGRTEHIINCHIEEVPENGADVAHLPQVHGPLITTGTDLRYMYSKLWRFAKHEWKGGWTQHPDDKHIGELRLRHSFTIFGFHLPLFDVYVIARQIGPGIVNLELNSLFGKGAFLQMLAPRNHLEQRMINYIYLNRYAPTCVAKLFLWSEAIMIGPGIVYLSMDTIFGKGVFMQFLTPLDSLKQRHVCQLYFKSFVPNFIAKVYLYAEAMMIGPGVVILSFESLLFGKGAYMQVITPVDPLHQRIVHHLHVNRYCPSVVGKLFVIGEAIMLERDIMIWNNKKYEIKPLFVKSSEDALIARHRRWYSQFYSENSKRFKFQQDTLEF